MKKRLAVALVAAVVLFAVCAIPAFAEGYNNGQYNFKTGQNETTYGGNAGTYVRTPASSVQTTSFTGPHGGYMTTTNKCEDCHSTHYATGKYMLLRADGRTDACNFCHVGGGGSKTNIQMDNSYSATSAVATDTMGYGTGHTLGYKGAAPAGINPAFSDQQGLACFDCHSPHGNSARVLGFPFSDPGRKMGGTVVQAVYRVGDVQGTVFAAGPVNIATAANGPDGTYWGLSIDEGNYVLVTRTGGVNTVAKKPVWPAGRFLILKDPNPADNDMNIAAAGTTAKNGTVKYGISWDNPIGPADAAYGGDDLARAADPTWNDVATPNHMWPKGILSVNEFCADCHNGAAGMSTQAAEVYRPNPSDTTTGSYVVAYSHDAQPRH